jgi:uncharacterized integral membrane protein
LPGEIESSANGGAYGRGAATSAPAILRGGAVRVVCIGLIVVFTAIVLLFKIQNLETATVTLFSASVTLPVSVLVVGVYVLGMLSGSFLVSVLRSWIRGARSVD